MPVQIADFLSTVPCRDGIYDISAPRPFHHDESAYGQNRPAVEKTPEFSRTLGEVMLAALRSYGYSDGDPILEIGCGSGTITRALVSHPAAGRILATDPSPAFCRITRQNILDNGFSLENVDIGILLAEDIHLLDHGSASLILLRSVLHHILDIDTFLRHAAAILPPGGLIVCEEPYYEGYLIMGLIAQFIPDAMQLAGTPCSPEDLRHIELFIATMQFYCRRDIDKSEAEDKHLFRPAELFASAQRAGLAFEHHPNAPFSALPDSPLISRKHFFEQFFATYARYSMSWPQDLVDRAMAAMRKHFRYFAPIESASNTIPHCYGTFVFKRR